MKDKDKIIIGLGFLGLLSLIGFKKPKIKDITNDLPKNSLWPIGSKSNIDGITIHHTATGVEKSPYDIAMIHVNKGWAGIGYDYLVYRDGSIYQVNRLESINWHNGVDNSKKIGIAMVGNMDLQPPSKKQLAAVINLSKWLKKRKDLNLSIMEGHGEKKATKCPGIFTDMDFLRKSTGLILPTS